MGNKANNLLKPQIIEDSKRPHDIIMMCLIVNY